MGSRQPITEDTVFRIASVTKTMTGIGVMQLREAGAVELDEPVNGYLRSFRIQPPTGAREVTARDLLTHTSGLGEIPRLRDAVRPKALGFDRPGSPGADLAVLYGGVLRSEVPAGQKWAYANHGFAVLGQVIQDVTGTSLPDHMRRRLFAPLGMTTTSYLRTAELDARAATGHRLSRGGLRPVNDYDRSLPGPGAVRSTISDMVRYAQALLCGGERERARVLRAASLAEMWSPQFSPDDRIPGIGLAFFLGRLGDHRTVGHDGNLPGFASALLLAPEDGVGVAVLANTATVFGAHLIAERVLREVLAVATMPAAAIAATSTPRRLAAAPGRYAPRPGLLTNVRVRQLLGLAIQVRADQGSGSLALRGVALDRTVRRGAADPQRSKRSGVVPDLRQGTAGTRHLPPG